MERLLFYTAARLVEAASRDLSLHPEAATAVYRAKVTGTQTVLDASQLDLSGLLCWSSSRRAAKRVGHVLARRAHFYPA
jgi:hypothetical protein